MIVSLGGQSPDRLSALRRTRPVAFAALLGLLIAVIGLASGGLTAGSGTEAARHLLRGEHQVPGAEVFGLLKFITTKAETGVGVMTPGLALKSAFLWFYGPCFRPVTA